MRRTLIALIVSLACAAPPALAQAPAESNPLEGIGNAVRGLFNRLFGGDEKPAEPAKPAEAPPAEPPKPPPAVIKAAPIARTVDKGLHDAIARGDVDSALKMIDRGADIEARDPAAGASPLHFAVMKGSLPVIEMLLTRGADINSRTRNGTTPLHTAALYARIEVAELLVGKGADINAQSASGATPLAVAVAARNEPMAERLKTLGAR